MKRREIVHRIADVMHHTAPDAQTILYGSEARGDARPDSDIDLLILIDGSELTPDRELAMRRPLSELEAQTGVAINAMVLLRHVWDSVRTPFTINVLNEGVVL
ncbi:MAG: nucleotidyltransferase domain-containing protein [Prevotellaceae bacterium]|jgi:predicted nucleotidyltransferase|nr:nucleotidyltransferase domain-containing protein [Prevotellaceae bacterium]